MTILRSGQAQSKDGVILTLVILTLVILTLVILTLVILSPCHPDPCHPDPVVVILSLSKDDKVVTSIGVDGLHCWK